MSDVIQSKNVAIRKPHTCFSCLRQFPILTKMNYTVGIFEGDFNAVYSCMTCVEIMNTYDETVFPEGFVNDMLHDGQTPEDLLNLYRQDCPPDYEGMGHEMIEDQRWAEQPTPYDP